MAGSPLAMQLNAERIATREKLVLAGYPPAWMDLQDKAITAGIAYRPATEADAKKLEAMAKDCGSIFKREEDLVAHHSPYPHHPHECCEGEWA